MPQGAGRVLYISCPADQRIWLKRAKVYWTGRFEGLESVHCSPFAVVEKWSDEEGVGYFFKRFLMRDGRDRLKHIFRASRACRDLVNSLRLREHDFNAPESVCFIEERTLGFVVGSGLIMLEIEDARNVRDYLKKADLGVAGVPARKQVFVKAFAREVAAFHQAGFHHGDSRIGNIMCRPEGDGYIFFWLDNERTTRSDRLPHRLRTHNLMQLNTEPQGASRTDRMRFWRAYAEQVNLPKDELLRIRDDALARTQARWKRRGWL